MCSIRWSRRALVLLMILPLLAAACGGGGADEAEVDTEETTESDAAAATEPTADGTDTEQAIEAGGEEPSGEPIVLGAYAGSTGVLQAFGSFEDEGWAIAEAHLNEGGGILGRPVEIVFQDTGSDGDQAASIMEGFVSDQSIIGVMGPTSSGNAFSSHPIGIAAGMPIVAVSNNAPGIVEQGEVVHRISVPEETLLPTVVETIVADLGIERAAILHAQDDPFSEAGYVAFEAALAALDVEVSNVVAYASATPDLGPQIRQLADGEPDAVFVAAFAEDAGSFLRQARQNGLDVPVIGNASFNSPAQLEIAGDAAAGLIIGSQWWLEDPDARNQRFDEDYREQFDRAPGNFGAMAYNGAYVIKDALEASGDATREGLQSGLLSLDGYDHLGALIQFVDRDSVTDEPIILMVEEANLGAFVEYDPSAF